MNSRKHGLGKKNSGYTSNNSFSNRSLKGSFNLVS